MMQNSSKTTLRQLAESAGCAASTVSRALTGSGYVSPQLRNQILKLARESGYFSIEQRNVAVLIPETADFHGYLGLMLQALLGELSRQKFCPVILQENNDVQLDETILRGVITLAYRPGATAGWCNRHRLPLVSINTAPALRENIYSVCSDDKQGMKLALEYLFRRGHRRIGLLTLCFLSPEGNLIQATRFRSFLELCDRTPEVTGFHRNLQQRTELHRILRELVDENCTAIIAAGESLGAITAQALRDFRLRIPEDISLISSEDSGISSCLTPPQTTIRQEMGRICAEAVNMLNRQIAGLPVHNVTVPYSLLERKSVADMTR